jgi:polyhydroxyalkanoate synthesis regulator phasin
MPIKKNQENQVEQSERFKQAVHDLVDAGELNPTEAEATMERLLKVGVQKRPESSDSSNLD